MWWKIYFWLDVFLAAVSVLSLFDVSNQNYAPHVFLIVTYCLALAGLYSYIYKKTFFSLTFWKYYFWIYLAIDVIYFIFVFIPAPYSNYIAFLNVYPKTTVWDALIGTALDIPLLYSLYQLKKGHFYEKSKKKEDKGARFQWGMLQMALWGYSLVLTALLFIMAFFPSGQSGQARPVDGPVAWSALASILLLFVPLLIFWLWIVFTYKKYRWNWWRTTLVANALLYSGSMMFGLLFPSQDKGPAGFDIISSLQLLILLLSLYVFGRDQFKSSKN